MHIVQDVKGLQVRLLQCQTRQAVIPPIIIIAAIPTQLTERLIGIGYALIFLLGSEE